jgi:tetratricopeptide (TPR) repeat protein
MGTHFERAQILFEQQRHALAETELHQELADDPNHPPAHALLALCLSERQEYAPATREAEMAVHLAPDLPFAHYALASVRYHRDHYPEAEAAIDEAIRLDPENADYHSLRSAIHYEQRRWPAALEAAEEGLHVDPEHVGCNNLRAMALVKLGRRAEAGATIETALARDPENGVTHANQGWALLEQGQPYKAMEHFREALRLEPELEWARQGIVEALKARHLIYRLMLWYFLWMAKLSYKAQWAVIIGGYIGYRLVLAQAQAHPRLAPWLWPILGVYIAFVILTWTAKPLFNLLLRLNRFGRLALSREQILASNLVGSCLLLALFCVGAWLWTGNIDLLIFGAGGSCLLIIPVAAIFDLPVGWPRWVMVAYTAAMALVGLLALALLLLGSPLFILPGALFLLGVVLDTWVANALMMVRPRR